MLEKMLGKETLDELRTLDIFREASDRYGAARQGADRGLSQETQAICHALLVAADVLRRTIIATHDAQLEVTHYNP
jgi:hypothetical protein